MGLLQGEPDEAFEWFKVDRAVGNIRNHRPARPSSEAINGFSEVDGLGVG